jgi:hypothetical protein
MGTRTAAVLLTAVLVAGCSDDDSGVTAQAEATTDADCAELIPEDVFTTLGWAGTPEGAEYTVRGCHREAEQGYVEVRERRGYRKLCRTLDHTGGLSPGTPVDWLGEGVTACAVEPAEDVGQTKVLVKGTGDEATLVTIAVLTSTPRERVRAAVAELVG